MANASTTGFGLKPIKMYGNGYESMGLGEYPVAASSDAIYFQDAVCQATTGYVIVGVATTLDIIGSLNGVFYTDATTSKPTFSNFYPAATTPANSEDITAFVNDDPFQEYIIATDATLGGTLALRKSKIGLTYATTAAAGSTATGKSSIQLGISTAATTAKQLRMVRIAEDPENKDQTAANCSVVVKVNLHQYTVGSLATGI